MAMTRTEAEQFVADAERLPLDQIDAEKLAEAIKVLSEASSAKVDLSAILAAIAKFEADLDKAVLEARKGRTEAFEGSAAARLFDALGDIRSNISRLAEERTFTPRTAQAESNPLGQALALADQLAAPPPSRAIDGPGREGPPPVRVPGARGSADPATRKIVSGLPPTSALPPGLIPRLYQAADRVGVPHEQVRKVIQDAQTQASGGLPPEIAAAYAASGQDAPLTVEQILEQQIADWMAAEGPIGVPADFVAVRETTPDPSAFYGRPDVSTIKRPSTGVLPRYFEGDQFNLAGLAPEKIVDIQKRLEAAGLIGEGVADYWSGIWDDTTAAAVFTLMAQANRSGTTWEAALEDRTANVPESVKEARNAAKLAEQFQAPAFIKPDYATLAQDVKSVMRQRLGREPNAEEMAELTGAMNTSYRSWHDQEVVGAARAEWEAEQAGLETGVAVTPGDVQGVDPMDRFLEEFDVRFAPETRFIENQADMFEATQLALQSLAGAHGLMGGR